MYEDLKEKALLLPKNSGVYIMEDRDGKIIYIGKAKNLKNRVSQYFSNLSSHNEKTLQMVRRVENFRVVVTKTEFDALLLESQLIKQHKPKYNILLKDDKGYPFVRLGTEMYPHFTIENRKKKDKARWFGPYASRKVAKDAIELAMNMMQLPTCSRVFPRDFGKERPCLNYHMEKCLGFCKGDIPYAKYQELMEKAVRILEGKYEGLEKEFEDKMMEYSENLEFEKAAHCRDTIAVLQKLGKGQGVFSKNLVDTDVVAYKSRNMRGALVRMSYIAGTLLDKETIFFEGSDDSRGAEIIESFLKQYYEARGYAPKNIVISENIEDREPLEQYISHFSGRKVSVIYPIKSEKHDMVLLALENAAKELELKEKIGEKTLKSSELLQELLGIDEIKRIESYDISHTGGDKTVCGCVVFSGGKPLKKAYKRFRIESAAASDDYGAMSEALGRRFKRAFDGDEGFLPLPDLILMDGGKGQVNAALEQMKKYGFSIPVCGMVKDDRHRTRELIDENGKLLGIDTKPALFAFITRVQDEVHRFALEYHDSLRKKAVSKSVLDNIQGVGEERKKALLKAFKTVSAIKSAELEELSKVVPKNTALSVYQYFRREK